SGTRGETMKTSDKVQTPFADAALTLDSELLKFENLEKELGRLAIESDKGFERGLELLKDVEKCHKHIESGMKGLVSELDNARQRNEKAAEEIAQRAILIQQRKLKSDELYQRFKTLGEMAEQINEAVLKLKGKEEEIQKPDAQALLANGLPQVDQQLGVL